VGEVHTITFAIHFWATCAMGPLSVCL